MITSFNQNEISIAYNFIELNKKIST